jgi:hypothetical protein
MSSDLMKRLRKVRLYLDDGGMTDIGKEAADHIKALERDLSDALDRASANLARAVAAEDKLRELEAKR